MRSRSHSDPTSSASRRRLAIGAAVAAAAVGASALVAPAAQAADPVLIDLVTVNDFHGRIEAISPSGGVAALATAVNQIRAGNPNTVFAAAGDMIGASTFTSFIQDDVPTIETLNAAGLEVSAAGNHEFDQGWEDLRDRVQGLADWEYISANVIDTATGEPALAPYWTKTMGDVSVGFIGAVTEELPSLVNPAGIAGLEVRDIVESVNESAADLSDGAPENGEADVIVLLVHEGAPDTSFESATSNDNPFGVIVNGVSDEVNAIVSGHTHLAYNHQVPYGGDTGLRPVISSGQYGERFSDMKISVDPDTNEVLSMESVTYDMWTLTPPPAVLNYEKDAAIEAVVQEAVLAAAELGSVELGSITADFNRARTSATNPNGQPVENRGGESTLGNFVADVQLWSGQQSDPSTQIAFMNPGGLRTNLVAGADGIVTYQEAALVQPFANTLVNLTLSGDQIRAVLEQQWQPDGSTRPFLKLGVSKGLEYTFDDAAAAGSRIQNLSLDGAPVDPAASYRVVVNSFLAGGGDNFTTFAEGDDKSDTGRIDLQSMVDYLEEFGTASPDLAQRSIGVKLSAPGANGYPAGGTIDLELSSLDFTSTAQPAGTVAVSIDGVAVGSAPVDSAPPATPIDTSGTATLSVTVPDGVVGTVPLTITTPLGTSIDVPITVAEAVVPVKSWTFGWPSTFIARQGATISFTTLVFAADGSTPTGELTIYDGSTPIATATLAEADDGYLRVPLPPLSRGTHRLYVAYSGSDTVEPSRSRWLPVRIL